MQLAPGLWVSPWRIRKSSMGEFSYVCDVAKDRESRAVHVQVVIPRAGLLAVPLHDRKKYLAQQIVDASAMLGSLKDN